MDGFLTVCIVFILLLKGKMSSNPKLFHARKKKQTQILVHVKDALDKGCRSVLVHTVDTDVVILISQFH